MAHDTDLIAPACLGIDTDEKKRERALPPKDSLAANKKSKKSESARESDQWKVEERAFWKNQTRTYYPQAPFSRDEPPIVGRGHHFIVHVNSGLEVLAEAELAELGCTNIRAALVSGKVFFESSASAAFLRTHLRCAEKLSLLVWAAPPPLDMPEDDVKGWTTKIRAILEDQVLPQMPDLEAAWRSATEKEAAATGSCSSPIAGGAATTHSALNNTLGSGPLLAPPPSPPSPLRFRASAKRSGAVSGSVTSVDMARAVGAFFCRPCGWEVDLKHHEVEVEVAWHQSHVILSLPLTNRYHLGEVSLASRPYMHNLSNKALRAPVAWALVSLARPQPGEVVLDSVCGRGGLLIEGALAFGRRGGEAGGSGVQFIGADKDEKQVQACVANLRGAAAYFQRQSQKESGCSQKLTTAKLPPASPPSSPSIETARTGDNAKGEAAAAAATATATTAEASRLALLSVQVMRADATHLPLKAGSVDVVVMDLPFGKKHGKQKGLCRAVVAEAARVLKPLTGRCVVFTTSRQEVYGAVVGDSRWSPVSRTEVLFSGLRAWIHLLARTEVADVTASNASSDDGKNGAGKRAKRVAARASLGS